MIELDHLSYSAIKDFECPLRFKLNWLDRLPRQNNEFAVFGTAIHNASENLLAGSQLEEQILFYKKQFKELLLELPVLQFQADDIRNFKEQGEMLLKKLLPAFNEFYGESKWELLSKEFELLEPIEGSQIKFKGFIDLIIKTAEKINIIDIKTCSWGWAPQKKSDTLVTYQLTYYKHFYSQKMNIPLKDIDCYFVLLKRTAPKDNIEFVKTPVGERKIKNSLSFLNKIITEIHTEKFRKNKAACKFCPYKSTDYCH